MKAAVPRTAFMIPAPSHLHQRLHGATVVPPMPSRRPCAFQPPGLLPQAAPWMRPPPASCGTVFAKTVLQLDELRNDAGAACPDPPPLLILPGFAVGFMDPTPLFPNQLYDDQEQKRPRYRIAPTRPSVSNAFSHRLNAIRYCLLQLLSPHLLLPVALEGGQLERLLRSGGTAR